MQQYFLLQGKGLQLPKGDKEVAAENNSSGIFFAAELPVLAKKLQNIAVV